MRIMLLAALLASVLSSSLFLSGCGQKGPLFIPNKSPSNSAAPSQPAK